MKDEKIEKNKDLRLNEDYRPTKFKEVVGQKKPVKTLKGSIATNRVQNAYILEGETGSGKTTLARIFSNALICRNRAEDCEPCGECEACVTFKSNKSLVDVIEIDAGENRGIDKIRELKDSIKYTPKEAYRVVIIDEAHMLTKEGATALLKPIEEPPERTIFLILTTETDKIMDTIRNRCIKLKFNKVAPHLIEERLAKIASENNIEAEENVLMNIAISSNGVLREAINILQQVSIMVSDRKIKEEDLAGLITVEEKYIKEMLGLIFKRDVVGVMNCIDREEESISKVDFDYFISRLRRYLYQEDISVRESKLISLMINTFMEYKNKILYNISPKTLIELSAIDSISIAEDNLEATEWLLGRFGIQNKDDISIALEKESQMKCEDSDEGVIVSYEAKSNDVIVDERTEIVKDKAELFMSLMGIKFRDFEYKFKSCELEINEEKILNFTVESREKKSEITSFLKREYAQSLKPICDIEGFIVKVR